MTALIVRAVSAWIYWKPLIHARRTSSSASELCSVRVSCLRWRFPDFCCSADANRKARLNILAKGDADADSDVSQPSSPTPSQERSRLKADARFLAPPGPVEQGPPDPLLDEEAFHPFPVKQQPAKKRKRAPKFALPPAAEEIAQAQAEICENARSGACLCLRFGCLLWLLFSFRSQG